MAHLRSIEQACLTCGGRATVQLFNNRNGDLGVYCKRDGDKALKELQAREDAAG